MFISYVWNKNRSIRKLDINYSQFILIWRIISHFIFVTCWKLNTTIETIMLFYINIRHTTLNSHSLQAFVLMSTCQANHSCSCYIYNLFIFTKLILELWLTLCNIINLSTPYRQSYQHQFASFSPFCKQFLKPKNGLRETPWCNAYMFIRMTVL